MPYNAIVEVIYNLGLYFVNFSSRQWQCSRHASQLGPRLPSAASTWRASLFRNSPPLPLPLPGLSRRRRRDPLSSRGHVARHYRTNHLVCNLIVYGPTDFRFRQFTSFSRGPDLSVRLSVCLSVCLSVGLSLRAARNYCCCCCCCCCSD